MPGRLRRALPALLIALPLLSLALCAIAWLAHGIDLPFFDDWRGYANGRIQSLNPHYLFKPANDTMAPIGFALDALAQRAFDGNSIAYQFVSMLAVLGALLLLQWKLLRAALGDSRHAALCFVLTLPMLQPGSYWGRENLAYHQALPLVFLLAALWVMIVPAWRERWRAAAMFGLGLAAGLVYISGAFGTVAAGGALLVLAALRLPPALRRRLAVGGAALFTAGAVTAITQFRVAVLPVFGRAHRPGAPIAWPFELDFWLFYLGKIGRAMMLPAAASPWALALVIAFCVVVAGLVAWLLRQAAARNDDLRLARVTVVLATLVTLVGAYLMLVASGRTYLRPWDVMLALDVFASGFVRFHFFWVTVLWPWVGAAVLLAVESAQRRWPRQPWATGAGAGLALLVGGFTASGAFAHFARFETDAYFRRPTIQCLQEHLQAGRKIDCEEFNLADLRRAFIHAREIGASFVRYFPIPLPVLGQAEPVPWFQLARDRSRMEVRDVTPGRTLASRAGADAAWLLQVAHAGEMAACVVIDVQASIRVERPDFAQVFWRPLGVEGYSEADSRTARLVPGRDNVIHFRLESANGFGDSIRLDPVAQSQEFEVKDLEVRCRLLDPRFTGEQPFFVLQREPLSARPFHATLYPNNRFLYRAQEDPQLHLDVDDWETLARCGALRAEVILRTLVPEEAQLYFTPRGEQGFSEARSVTKPLAPASQARPVVFEVQSATGFEPLLRLDPVRQATDFELIDIRLSCRQRIAPR